MMKVEAMAITRLVRATAPRMDATKASETPSTSDTSLTRASLSQGAQSASAMFEAANAYVRDEHLEPFSAYNRGTVSPGAYINVERYNDHIFDSAASKMVEEGAKAGISLDKNQIIEALKRNNSDISSIRNDESKRKQSLGQSSFLSELSPSDLDSMTDLYISAKEKGADLRQVEVVACDIGMVRRDSRLGIRTVVYDPQKELTGYGNVDANQTVSASSPEPFDKIKAALYGKLGLPTAMINLLVDSVKAGNDRSAATLEFLRKLI